MVPPPSPWRSSTTRSRNTTGPARIQLASACAPMKTEQWRTVIGVVRDVHHGGLTVSEGPTIYIPHAQKSEAWMTWMSLAVHTKDDPLRKAATAIRARSGTGRAQSTGVEDVGTLGELVDEALALPRLAAFVATAVAGITLLLAAAGLASTLSLLVQCAHAGIQRQACAWRRARRAGLAHGIRGGHARHDRRRCWALRSRLRSGKRARSTAV